MLIALKINTLKFRKAQQTFLRPSCVSFSRFGEILISQMKSKPHSHEWEQLQMEDVN